MSRRPVPEPGRPSARRPPAAWLRRRLLTRLLVLLVPTLVSGGVCLGALLAQLLAQWVPLLYLSCAAAAAAAAVAIFHGWQHYDRRWSLSNLERGIDAEYRVGQVVDYALVPRNCAVAHGVVDIAAEGDIDHLVATPQALWVVETKVRAVPKKQFPAVLDRIARNVHAVEAWASGVPVRGCLVLLDGFPGKREYEARDGTPVVVHDEKSLRNALRREVRGEEGAGGGWSCTTRRACATRCAGRCVARRGRAVRSLRAGSGSWGGWRASRWPRCRRPHPRYSGKSAAMRYASD